MTRVAHAHGLIFDAAPSLYDRYRPGYPPDAVTDLVNLAVTPPSLVLEIGAGTGQLTEPLIERGLAVTALEPGRRMAALLTRKLQGEPLARIIVARFEDAEIAPVCFDAVVSSSSSGMTTGPCSSCLPRRCWRRAE